MRDSVHNRSDVDVTEEHTSERMSRQWQGSYNMVMQTACVWQTVKHRGNLHISVMDYHAKFGSSSSDTMSVDRMSEISRFVKLLRTGVLYKI